MRYAAIFFTVFAVGVLGVCAFPARAQSAGEMLRSCKGLLDAKPGPQPGEIAFIRNFDTGQCWGAFRTFQQLSGLQFNGDATRALNICAPSQVTLLQWVSVFSKYVNDHPADMHEDWWLIGYRAFSAPWGCEK